MGFFGGQEVVVSSSVYNMAGDPTERPDFLKTLVNGQIISDSNFGMSETLQQGYVQGPGIRARSFFNWANTPGNYPGIGVPGSGIKTFGNLDMSAIQAQIPVPSGYTAAILDVHYGPGQASYWGEQYILEHYQDHIGDAWTVDSDDSGNITLHMGGTIGDITFAASSPIDDTFLTRYFYVTYFLKNESGTIIGTRMWIYKSGSGNAYMDGLVTEYALSNKYLPFIPIRIDNQFLSDTYMSDLYASAKKGYKKAFRQKYDKLITKIADNPSIDDIDHAYVVHAVTLNTHDNSSRRYLYDFFHAMIGYSPISVTTYQTWRETSYSDYTSQREYFDTQRNIYAASIDGTGDPDTIPPAEDPAVSTPPPFYPAASRTQLAITGPDATRFKMIIKWRTIQETTGTGLRKPTAKVGDVWIDVNPSYDTGFGSIHTPTYSYEYEQLPDDEIIINWQIDADNWKSLQIIGLVHENYPYVDKAVTTTAKDALMGSDESGFLVPINYEIMRQMSLIDSTQMMTQSAWLVFNCYEIVKTPWYATGFFKLVIFVAMIAITIVTAGTGTIAMYASLGALLGLSGTLAVVAGAVITALASMILMKVLATVSTAVFGEKFGLIIAAIATVIASAVGGGMMGGQSFSQSLSALWGNLTSAPTLIQMTSAVGNGVAAGIQAGTADYLKQTQDLLDQYQKESKNISELFAENIGYGRGFINPLSLTDVDFSNPAETSQQFLTRTMITGSDIAEMSMDMVANFSRYTLDTSLPIGT